MGPMTLKITRCLFLVEKQGNWQNFGINLNKILNKILVNLNILPEIIAEVLLLL